MQYTPLSSTEFRSQRRRAARRQGICSAIVMCLAIGCMIAVERRPDDAESLKIVVSKLRSQAAEAELLAELRSESTHPFVSAHTRQLDQNVQRAIAELRSLDLRESRLLSQRHQAFAQAKRMAPSANTANGNDTPAVSAVLSALEEDLQ